MSVATLSPSAPVTLESLTISPDVVRHHYVARAVIFDLQPDHMVAAIVATEAAIRATHRFAQRTGWSATSDGLRIYFHEWIPNTYASPVTEALPRSRQALGANAAPVPAASVEDTSTQVALPPCPTCGGVMVAVERLTVRQLAVHAWIEGLALDSS